MLNFHIGISIPCIFVSLEMKPRILLAIFTVLLSRSIAVSKHWNYKKHTEANWKFSKGIIRPAAISHFPSISDIQHLQIFVFYVFFSKQRTETCNYNSFNMRKHNKAPLLIIGCTKALHYTDIMQAHKIESCNMIYRICNLLIEH